MQEFYLTLLSFPAALFTGLLGIVLLYWLFVIIGALDLDVAGDGDLGDLFAALGFAGVPASIALSLLTLFAWVLAVPATYFLLDSGIEISWLRWVLGAAILAGAGFVSMGLTLVALRPLRSFFTTHAAPSNERLVGKVCVVSTLKVTADFGQATYDDKGAGLIVQIRAETPNSLKKGDTALMVAYDAATSAYTVVPYGEFLDA